MGLELVKSLREAFATTPLPGEDGHRLLAPRHDGKYYLPSDDYIKAGVVLVLYYQDSEWYIVIIKRTSGHINDKHAGQLSFPGGKYDDTDLDMEKCALRELYEEIGIKNDDLTIVGSLTPLYVFVSNFMVYPYVGVINGQPNFSLKYDEVESLFSVSMSQLLQNMKIQTTEIKIRSQSLPNVPYIDVNGHVLWGATAMILSEFILFVRKAGVKFF